MWPHNTELTMLYGPDIEVQKVVVFFNTLVYFFGPLNSIEITFFHFNDALMAAAGDAHQPFVLNIKIQRLFPIDPADNGDSKYKRRHARDDRV